MSKEAKILIAILVVIVGGMIGLFALGNGGSAPGTAGDKADPSKLVREDSHKLSTAPDGKVTIVEFLDFECEACGANYPDVEKIRSEYGDKITFVTRYFPLSNHRNAQLAAQSVEAAGRQGKFEEMYQKMYENQKEWAEQQVPQTAIFERFAVEIGLDTAKFKADQNDPAVAERVKKDQADGEALGVQATPTFFFNGEQLQGIQKYEELKAKIDAALKQ